MTLNLTVVEKKSYKAVVAAIEKFCSPKKNEVYKSFIFNNRKQGEGESFDAYLLDLKKLVKSYKDKERMISGHIGRGQCVGNCLKSMTLI